MRNGEKKSARQFGPKMISTVPIHHREQLKPLVGLKRVESDVDMMDCESVHGDIKKEKSTERQPQQFQNRAQQLVHKIPDPQPQVQKEEEKGIFGLALDAVSVFNPFGGYDTTNQPQTNAPKNEQNQQPQNQQFIKKPIANQDSLTVKEGDSQFRQRPARQSDIKGRPSSSLSRPSMMNFDQTKNNVKDVNLMLKGIRGFLQQSRNKNKLNELISIIEQSIFCSNDGQLKTYLEMLKTKSSKVIHYLDEEEIEALTNAQSLVMMKVQNRKTRQMEADLEMEEVRSKSQCNLKQLRQDQRMSRQTKAQQQQQEQESETLGNQLFQGIKGLFGGGNAQSDKYPKFSYKTIDEKAVLSHKNLGAMNKQESLFRLKAEMKQEQDNTFYNNYKEQFTKEATIIKKEYMKFLITVSKEDQQDPCFPQISSVFTYAIKNKVNLQGGNAGALIRQVIAKIYKQNLNKY